MSDIREDRFTWEEGDVSFSDPCCRNCKYGIYYGVKGCKLNIQTRNIILGIDKCNKKKLNEDI